MQKMILDKKYAVENEDEIIKNILEGKIFIYPTDTIYGIGCSALNKDSIAKIRRLKQRALKPFSIIAPNMSWIKENCETIESTEEHLGKLPGPYTLFLKLKNSDQSAGGLPEEVNPLENGTIGIRIPRCWFTDIISKAGIPFITTSVNVSGMPYMTEFDDLDETIKNNVDFIIYEGEIKGRESTKIDLTRLV
jgi:tRNA threonylcarbamoyl adenosine modification protein (Sua5/YciO/YrdC/YwlC family)